MGVGGFTAQAELLQRVQEEKQPTGKARAIIASVTQRRIRLQTKAFKFWIQQSEVPQEAILRLEYYCGEAAVISEFNNMKLDLES